MHKEEGRCGAIWGKVKKNIYIYIWSNSRRIVFKFCYQSTSLVQEIYSQNELCILEKMTYSDSST